MESPSPSDIIGEGGMGGVPSGFPDYGHDWHDPQLRLGGIEGSGILSAVAIFSLSG
jgi:hypothetical protein